MRHKPTEKTDEAQKAKKLLDKDMPDSNKQAGHEGSSHQEPQPSRPEENVDNQKAEKNPSTPHHNTSIKETPLPGAQLTKNKKAHKDNIDQKTEENDPKGSE